ncbi:methionine--tRNA ligase [Halanaerobium sp. ST460_2HS_T2]|jgi:methionyl-tRNA synthetase|uniref:methionine--tRNA ligase n=1 Tax=Halanaerobium TaxID=2330 RepID=UPI000797623E|nr:methionine--tRNA ligase [Halanaerobium sp. ST460_2HS_T2]KXS47901.1 MAG: methionyl-tRNA synthetase [Halanaerobium sp. T82-1]PUU88065.1 MAG: methionyl-tRNA synthetase [Halanaerobium sp.]RCW62279.1 methionyl-tRNA synthetase [Halanaerobium sp. ST460_2HS_T2]
MTIFIGGAWPYTNGSLHLGHLASLLPGDILARYYRLKGEQVLYVSGSDCHGTPIALRAKEENVEAKEIADNYHREFKDSFEKLGFTYDLYMRTDDSFHHQKVKEFFNELYQNEYIYEKKVEQLYCSECDQYLADRYVLGRCPECGEPTRGDQCESCSAMIEAAELKDKKCKICGSGAEVKETEHFYLALSELESKIEKVLQKRDVWRDNAVKLTEKYLAEGLKDRAVSRNLDWGIKVPLKNYSQKKIYVWVEAVLGYLTASQKWALENNADWKEFWQEESKSYYIHGKDNIPFHTIILPSLLAAQGNLNLPQNIVSSEYLTIEGRKLSTSKNWAVWVKDYLKNYNPDSIRYYLTVNGPEKRDSNFSWEEFINNHNGELLAAFGNFVNRTLVFIEKYFAGKIPDAEIDPVIADKLKSIYSKTGERIENTEFKEALENIFSLIRDLNKYFDQKEPWLSRKDNQVKCRETIYSCTAAIANLRNLLQPFLPFSTVKVTEILNLEAADWNYLKLKAGREINESEILFERIDKKQIEIEREKLKAKSKAKVD